jgi:hypothetical protein
MQGSLNSAAQLTDVMMAFHRDDVPTDHLRNITSSSGRWIVSVMGASEEEI